MTFFLLSFFFFNDTATTEIYTLSLHDALPILAQLDDLGMVADHDLARFCRRDIGEQRRPINTHGGMMSAGPPGRSEEHTSELQSRRDLVCRLLLEKKKKKKKAKAVKNMTGLQP